MARPLAATVLLLLVFPAFAGCLDPETTSPGLDNPQLVVYRTRDLVTQLVVKGAFRDREYDRVVLEVDGAPLAQENHTFLLAEKLNVSAFNLTVMVALSKDAYRWEGAFAVLPDGVRVSELREGLAGKPESRSWPYVKILEKEDPDA